MRVAIIVFPGSNCDHDAYYSFKKILNQPTDFVWHKETNLDPYDLIVLPGGFSYGDYLRCGAIARFSPVMKEVIEILDKEGLRESVKIVIGGAPVSQDFANQIGADAYGYDATSGVKLVKSLVAQEGR